MWNRKHKDVNNGSPDSQDLRRKDNSWQKEMANVSCSLRTSLLCITFNLTSFKILSACLQLCFNKQPWPIEAPSN